MTVDGLWRKNRRDNPGTACDGVDLNRNADLLWGITEGQPPATRAPTSTAGRPSSRSPRPATSGTCSTPTASTASPTCIPIPSSYSTPGVTHRPRRPTQRSGSPPCLQLPANRSGTRAMPNTSHRLICRALKPSETASSRPLPTYAAGTTPGNPDSASIPPRGHTPLAGPGAG
jgi:Zinc carboxypeptidase